MLRIAGQAKGRLFEETMALLEESDIKLSTTKRTLLVQSSNFPIEVLFLRDDDIPQTVATGVADLGIVGENEFMEKEEDAEIVKRLGFSKCRLSLAMPKDIEYPGLSWFEGKKIATSYPVILRNFLKKNSVNAEIHVITGSVEVSPGIGLADAIFDIVSSGSTLVSNRLKEVEVVMKSEALLIGNKNMSEEKKEKEKSAEPTEELKETGSANLEGSRDNHRIKLLTIVGEIEGHEAVSGNTKATKYEHLLPMLAEVEDSSKIDGLLILLNTLGGDVEAGLSIAEMIASLSKPTVSLVLGGSHSIGGPLAVSADYSFIVPSGTMVIHPVRSNGMFIGVQQSLDNMIRTQDRITRFLSEHSSMKQERIEELMLNPTELVKDVGTLLEGKDAVREGLIDAVGGLSDALNKLHEMISDRNQKKNENV